MYCSFELSIGHLLFSTKHYFGLNRTISCQKLTLTHFMGSWPWNIPSSGYFKELLNVSMLLRQLDCEVFKQGVIIERMDFFFFEWIYIICIACLKPLIFGLVKVIYITTYWYWWRMTNLLLIIAEYLEHTQIKENQDFFVENWIYLIFYC